jgi:hypothetical protein
MNIHSVREFNETEYDKVCMKKVYDIVEAHNLSITNNDNKQQDAKSLTSITTATSPASVNFLENKRDINSLPTHPPDVSTIQRKHNQDIKDEYYKHVNGFYNNYVASKAMWKAVLKGDTVPVGKKMETIEPTITSFLDTYTFFKEHEELLEGEIHPFKYDDHGVYDEFKKENVKDSLSNLFIINNCAEQYIEAIGLPLYDTEKVWGSRTCDQAARNLTEMLDGPERWPPRKIAYAMKALQNAALVSTPEPLVSTQLMPQIKSERMETLFGQARVQYALIGFTNIDTSEKDEDKYEVQSHHANYKSFMWLPSVSTDADHTKKTNLMLLQRFKTILHTALNDYIQHGNQEYTSTTKHYCSSDAMDVIQFFTGKDLNKKIRSAYETKSTETAEPTNSGTKKKAASLKRQRLLTSSTIVECSRLP